MKTTITKVATRIIGVSLVFASMGILTEGGLSLRFPRPLDWGYIAVGAPLFALGVWIGHRAGLRPIRLFARR